MAKNIIRTSVKTASKASELLKSNTSAKVKAIAGSALSNRRKHN